MSEKVSVIVPIYNLEKYLSRCVESLLAQKYPDVEILLIDDCSTDKSAEIARDYAARYPNCRFYRMDTNGGVSRVRNLGIEQSRGTWLAFVDGDDWVSPDYVSAMYEMACRDQADIVMSGCTYIWDDGRQADIPHFDLKTQSGHKEKVALCRCCMTAKLIRKQLFLDTGIRLSPEINRLEELNVIAPLVSYTDRISVTHQSYYYYYQRATSSSNQNTRSTDIEVFWKSVERMYRLSAEGFEPELEFHAICELLYGASMVMARGKKPTEEFVQHMDRFQRRFPNWRRNPYLSNLPQAKRIFVEFADKKQYLVLKMLIFAWDMRQKLR